MFYYNGLVELWYFAHFDWNQTFNSLLKLIFVENLCLCNDEIFLLRWQHCWFFFFDNNNTFDHVLNKKLIRSITKKESHFMGQVQDF